MSSPVIRLDLPPADATRLKAVAKLRVKRQENEVRYAADPWVFLCEAVWTLDQRGHEGGVKRYPGESVVDVVEGCACSGGRCVNYLHHLTRVWMTHPRLLIPKSRRLMASWTLVALHYWRARYVPARMIAFATRKAGIKEDEGSNELVKRAKFIHEHLPEDVMPRAIEYSRGYLHFPDNDSTIMAIAQGADQARQYTFSDYLADEFAFWEQAAETYGALYPTLENGGTFTGVSSAQAGFMQQLVFDAWDVGAGG